MNSRAGTEDFSNHDDHGCLPIELLTEVLVRVPIKTILQFKCVGKAWCSLISSLRFASLHFAHLHKDDDENPPFLTMSITQKVKKWMLFSSRTCEEITSDDDSRILNDQEFIDLVNSYYHPRGSSVNGLLLLYRNSSDIMLCNPMIGKTHKFSVTLFVNSCIRLGLGFNPLSHDYKVVVIATFPKISAQVYSLSTRTWRRVANYSESIIEKVIRDGVLINETIHFVSVDFMKRISHLVSFDVKDEVFNYVKLPYLGYCSYPIAYQDAVGILDIKQSCLWVMEKDLPSKSWMKLYSIDFQWDKPPYILCFKKNGAFLVPDRHGRVILYDVESKRRKNIIGISDGMMYSSIYKPSLALA